MSSIPIPTISGLSALAPRYDAIFCDVWGVLIDGLRCFPNAAAALRAFRGQGGRVALITNASRPSAEVALQLDALGVPRDCWDAIVTAGELTLREIVARRDQSCFHLGPPQDKGLFEAAARLGAPARLVGVEAADYVVCTGLVDDERDEPEDYDDRLRALSSRGLTMLCANPDVVVEVGGRRVYCAGALARRYDSFGGRVLTYGKPQSLIYDAARAALDGPQGAIRALAIGDGAETDLAGAGRAGLDCLFVTEGVHREEIRDAAGALDPEALERLFLRASARPVAMTSELVW
ncbi:TIGR01459 family HAD-type hydrolase [Methylocystis bryophila]|uniref:Haloacid dehalogenase n=1 Tax=Methylocystis bryophila TaxID=655015 RepID=A0A1W6MXT6_9HYPH|nr:TIGR01459 family HAD-type hydrolase [Methylocystis bryophila]ARN82381.1 haloacid dehalogenase [Methylocystis bryophila]BDV38549.1 haloacid dehalogenase [Methylocystis bryophila]